MGRTSGLGDDVTEASDRRNFLKLLVNKAAVNAREANVALGPLSPLNRQPFGLASLRPDPSSEPEAPETPDPRSSVPATAVARTADIEELMALADELGLGGRSDVIRSLAVESVRLTHVDRDDSSGCHSRFGGRPDLPLSAKWPTWRGERLPFVMQLDLAEPVLLEHTDMPNSGLLLVFAERTGEATGLHPSHVRSVRTVLVDPPAPQEADRRQSGLPIQLSTELSLPREWSADVQSLNLDEDELSAWGVLRTRLAQRQGVQLTDAGSDPPPALHRLFGFADETTGAMPLACELMAAGHDVSDGYPAMHPEAAASETAAGRWRLLLQLSADPDLGWSWGAEACRLYIWVDRDDLVRGKLDAGRPFRR